MNREQLLNSSLAVPRSMAGYLCFHYRRYSKTPPLCFALQNIGEVSEGQKG